MVLVKTPSACRAQCGDAQQLAQSAREKTTYATRPTLLLSRLHNFLLCASASAAAAAAGAWSFNNTGTIELKRRLGYYARCESLF